MATSALQDTTKSNKSLNSKRKDSCHLGKPIGDDCILTISDVAEIFDICPANASTLMKGTKKAIIYGKRIYMLEKSLLAWLHEVEGRLC